MKKLIYFMLAAMFLFTIAACNSKVSEYKVGNNVYKVWDEIKFGSYPFYEDGAEEQIFWQILDIDAKGNALVLSEYALDISTYDDSMDCDYEYYEGCDDGTWETSDIREWLNNDFINKAFNETERSIILTTTVSTEDNKGKSGKSSWHTKGGNDTKDKVFLLSIKEVEKYIYGDDGATTLTPYICKKEDMMCNDGASYYHSWWLRSPGGLQDNAAYVLGGHSGAHSHEGKIDYRGMDAEEELAVRPAFRINLNDLHKEKPFIGDIIKFGSWPVGIQGEVSKAIEWEILEKNDDGTAIILSRNVIDLKPYNAKLEDTTWRDSSLRKWLNDEFYNKAFTVEEKDKIEEIKLENTDNNYELTQAYIDWWKKWGKKTVDKKKDMVKKMNGKGGADTTDKVWLLSLDDIKKYGRMFSTDESRTTRPMEYLTKKNDFCTSETCKKNGVVGNAWWWLRSPGGEQKNAAYIHYSGFVHVLGLHVDNNGGVRPALKINLNEWKLME